MCCVMMNERTAVDVKAGIADLMDILEGASMKDVTVKFEKGVVKAAANKKGPKAGVVGIDGIAHTAVDSKTPYVRMVHAEEEVVVEKGTVYDRGIVISVDGKSVFTGNKKKGKGGAKGPKEDAGRDMIKDIYTDCIKENAAFGPSCFVHSSEGLIVRMTEADYSIKVSKSKENKIDMSEAGFIAEKDFSTRGKAQNSASAIAKALYNRFENEISNLKMEFAIVSAKASGIMLQGALGEYTVKISKKRDRVGFEAERASSYEK